MLWKVSELERFSLRGKDGLLGDVVELYFSDDSWIVRYLVVATGDWMERREFLISPFALGLPNGLARIIPTDLSREQVRSAPPVDARKPVSRHYEARYYDHFRWPYYWVGGPMWGPYFTPGELARATATAAPQHLQQQPENPHLRSTSEVTGYHFEGLDGDVGHIEDFIVSDDSWSIRYLEVDTRNWWPGKKVLLATQWAREVNWEERRLKADVTREAVKSAPPYDESEPISQAYELELVRHYGLDHAVTAFR